MWELYDRLIEKIPEDMKIADYICANSWTMVRADTGGIGLAVTGRETTRKPFLSGELKGMPIKTAAKGAKSWNMLEAGIGVAAMNAYYNDVERAKQLGIAHSNWQIADNQVFTAYKEQVLGKKVAAVGHFPPITKAFGEICELSILEKNPQMGDYPYSACEYILPEQDFVFITGVALIDKTLPRLLTLSQSAQVILVGPVVVLSADLFDFGVNNLSGFVVHDQHLCEAQVKRGTLSSIFSAGERVCYTK